MSGGVYHSHHPPPTACLSVHVHSHEHSWWFTYWRYFICYPERERGEASHVWCIFGLLLWLCVSSSRERIETLIWRSICCVVAINNALRPLSVSFCQPLPLWSRLKYFSYEMITVKCDFLFRATRFVVLSVLPGWLLVGLPWQQIQKSAFINC